MHWAVNCPVSGGLGRLGHPLAPRPNLASVCYSAGQKLSEPVPASVPWKVPSSGKRGTALADYQCAIIVADHLPLRRLRQAWAQSSGVDERDIPAGHYVVHEQGLTETMGAIPAGVSARDRDAAETELARHARSFNPTSLHRIGQHILAHLDPDGPAPRDEPQPAPTAGELRFLGAPRRATRAGGIPRTRTQRRVPDVDRTTCRTPICHQRHPRYPHRTAALMPCWRSVGTAPPGCDHRLGRATHRPRDRGPGLRDPHQRHGSSAVGL